MFKKMLLLKMEEMAKKDPKQAEGTFDNMMAKFNEMDKAGQEDIKRQFNDIYTLAKNLKCKNVVKYLDKFKDKAL